MTDRVRTPYKRGIVAVFAVPPLLFTPLAVLAWRETDVGGGVQWLPFVVGLPLLALWAWWRLHDASLTVGGDGVLRRRSAVRQDADLGSLGEVALTPSVPYRDQRRHEAFESGREGMAIKYAFDVEDQDGGRVQIAPRYVWVDETPVLAEVVDAVAATRARLDPRCWELLHRDAGLATPPLPERLTAVDPSTWGTPLTIRRANESTAMTPLRAAVVLGALPLPVMGFMMQASVHLGRAVTTLVGGVTALALGFWLIRLVVQRAERDVVEVHADGRLRSVSRRARWTTRLGLRLVEGSVDLRRLARAALVPGTATDQEGRPHYWVLELADQDGGSARVDLCHARRPYATFLPQLAHHLEAVGVTLDRTTHRGLSARLGRPLTNPVAD